MKISSLSLDSNITLRVGNRVGKSYLVIKKGFRKLRNPLVLLAGATRLELATSGVTGYLTQLLILNKIRYLKLFQ